MPLETGEFITDLVVTNPPGGDPKAQGDDHLRLLKKTVQQSFPNIDAAVTPTPVEINGWEARIAALEAVQPGIVVQVANFQTGESVVGSGIIPFDDTIPQITEGDEYMTLPFTPLDAANRLKIEVIINLGTGVTNSYNAVALFQDAIPDALAVSVQYENLANTEVSIATTHFMVAGSVDPTIFRVRAGKNPAGNTTFNGNSSARRYGGRSASSITITEYLP